MRSSTLYSGSRSHGLGARLPAQRCTRLSFQRVILAFRHSDVANRDQSNTHCQTCNDLQLMHTNKSTNQLQYIFCQLVSSKILTILYNVKTFYILFSLYTQINAEGFALQCFHIRSSSCSIRTFTGSATDLLEVYRIPGANECSPL